MSKEMNGKSYTAMDRPYKNFAEIMRKKGLKKSGQHASFYFDAFYLRSLTIEKASAVARKLYKEEEETFTQWRQRQIDLGLLVMHQTKFPNGSVFIKYEAGSLTLEYLNKLIIKNSQVATINDLEASEAKILRVTDDLQSQIDEMKGMLNVVATHYLTEHPPHTPQRRLRLLENIKKGKAYLEEDARGEMN